MDRKAVESFTESAASPAIGYEFFDANVHSDRGPGWEGRGFYVGPVRADGAIRCTVRFTNRKGRTYLRTPPDQPFRLHPETLEDHRDSIGLAGPLEVANPHYSSVRLEPGAHCRVPSE